MTDKQAPIEDTTPTATRKPCRFSLAVALMIALAFSSVILLDFEISTFSNFLVPGCSDKESQVIRARDNATLHQQLQPPEVGTDQAISSSGRPSQSLNVVFGLSGNHPGFLSEFEVALKSVLMNAPLQSSLGIHVMADQQAYDALEEIFDRTEVRTWRTRVPITIHTYNVEPKLKEWQARMLKTMHQFSIETITGGHTIGAFFRLFANEVVPDDVKHALYMDADAILMANIEELWRHLNPDSLFHWALPCVRDSCC
jgi:hypothetical protein